MNDEEPIGNSLQDLVSRALRNDRAAIGRMLTLLESPSPAAGALLKRLMSLGGRAHVIGVTGIPGSGKSTLISKLIGAYRGRGLRVGVIAVDPTSPLTRGSLMADRLRMQQHATDPNVFIRSLASKGFRGGLSLAALAMIEALDGIGYDKVIVETVGVGQADVDIMDVAHTIMVVTMPGAGDDIQALKAGVMEIGDIYVINKSDKPEAQQTAEFINFVLEIGELGPRRDWRPRVIKTSAVLGLGVDDLVEAIEEHKQHLERTGTYKSKIESRRMMLAKLFARRIVEEKVERLIDEYKGEIFKALTGSDDPYSKLRELIEAHLTEV